MRYVSLVAIAVTISSPLRGGSPIDTPLPKVIASERNFFYETLQTKQGPRDVWVQVKQQMPEGDNPSESFPNDQQIIYELWEKAPNEQAKQPLWRLTANRPAGPTWRSVAAKCIYEQSEDVYYLFLCHKSQSGEFCIFRVRRGAPQFMDFPNLSVEMKKLPAYYNRCRAPLKDWTFERGLWGRFHLELKYVGSDPPDSYDIPLPSIP